MLSQVGRFARRWAEQNPWTDVYGLARTMIALATAATLAFTPVTTFFRPAAGGLVSPFCIGPQKIGLFCVIPEAHLGLARWLAVALLLVIASGWRPRVTAIVHWWIAYSFQANVLGIDGGDNLTENLTLLMLPVALLDSRRSHFDPAPAQVPGSLPQEASRLVALFFLFLVRVQMAGVYFHASVGKFQVEQWTNGTAVWYWATSRAFGPSWLVAAILVPLFKSGIMVSLVTWWVMVVEWLLSAAIFMGPRMRRVMLWQGIALHVGIIALHGLWSFSTVMFAGLILYLHPIGEPIFKRGRIRKEAGGELLQAKRTA